MKNYNGMQPRAMNLGIITIDEFCSTYNSVSDKDNMICKASTIEFIKDSNGCQLYADVGCKMPLVAAIIFYDYYQPDNRQLNKQTGKVEETPEEPEFIEKTEQKKKLSVVV